MHSSSNPKLGTGLILSAMLVSNALLVPAGAADNPKIAMISPAYAQDNLYKALYNWSSVLTVEIVKPVNSKTANVGDVVEAKLIEDFRWGPQLIASRDSPVRGHIIEADQARTLTHSAVSSNRRLKSRGRLTLQFDEIIDSRGCRWSVYATPSPRQKNESNVDRFTGRFIEVDAQGHIVKAEAGLIGGLKATSDAVKIATMVPLPGTLLVRSLAPAVAMGAVGAASPSIAYDKPIDPGIKNRRTKGAAYGFFTNLPGAFAVTSVVEKGQEIELLPGDRLTLNVCIKDTGYRLPPIGDEQLDVSAKMIRSAATQSAQSSRLYPVCAGH